MYNLPQVCLWRRLGRVLFGVWNNRLDYFHDIILLVSRQKKKKKGVRKHRDLCIKIYRRPVVQWSRKKFRAKFGTVLRGASVDGNCRCKIFAPFLANFFFFLLFRKHLRKCAIQAGESFMVWRSYMWLRCSCDNENKTSVLKGAERWILPAYTVRKAKKKSRY